MKNATEPAIYKIENTVNGKVYIGSAVNPQQRKNQHLSVLRRGVHFNRYLQNAWDKYREKSFKFSILELVKNKTTLLEKEQYWMDYYLCYSQ